MEKKTKIITIDGPAASGKGTLARKLAGAIGFAYIDTGALYRMVAKAALDRGVNPADEEKAAQAALSLREGLSVSDFSDAGLRTEIVSQNASVVAALPKVRAALLDVQRALAHNPPRLEGGKAALGAVLDGRDTGTVICPDADAKFFVTASAEIRAMRRLKELQSRGFQGTYDAVLQDMRERDGRDSGRDIAPMKPADDAVVVDTSDMTAEQAFDAVYERVAKIVL